MPSNDRSGQTTQRSLATTTSCWQGFPKLRNTLVTPSSKPTRICTAPFESEVSKRGWREGWRQTKPPKEPKKFSRNVSPVSSRGIGKRVQKRGYKFGCVCSYVAGDYPGTLITCHIGTNTPKFVPPRWGRPPFDPTQTGLCKFGWVWSSLTSDPGPHIQGKKNEQTSGP